MGAMNTVTVKQIGKFIKKTFTGLLVGVFLFNSAFSWAQEEELFSAVTENQSFSSGLTIKNKLSPPSRFDYEELLKHSLTVAAICKYIEKEGNIDDKSYLNDVLARLDADKNPNITVLPYEIIIEIPEEGLAIRYFNPTKANVITPYSDVVKLRTREINPGHLNRQIIHRIKTLPMQNYLKDSERDVVYSATDMPIIVIGGSAGGDKALMEILRKMPLNHPPIVASEHNFSKFLRHVAESAEDSSQYPVIPEFAQFAKGSSHNIITCKKTRGEPPSDIYLKENMIVIARYPVIMKDENGIAFVRVYDELGFKLHHSQRTDDSVNKLFSTAAQHFGEKVTGVITAGFGKDGLEGAKIVCAAKGKILTQKMFRNGPSYYAPGMPNAVLDSGMPCGSVLIEDMGSAIVRQVEDLQNMLAKIPKSTNQKTKTNIVKSHADYVDKNKLLFKDMLGESKSDSLVRVPVEAIESLDTDNIQDFLATLQGAPNSYVELYHMSGIGKASESVYRKYGLRRKPLPKGFKRTRENTVTLLPVLKGEEIDQATIASRLGSLDISPQETILSPIGLQHDPAGLIRATILGLKIMDVAREIRGKGIDIFKDQAFKDRIQLEVLEDLKLVCDPDDLKGIDLTPDDIIAIATGSINNIITALKKLIKLLPITPIDAEELRQIFEHAKKVIIAA